LSPFWLKIWAQVICHQLLAHILRDIQTPIHFVIMGAPMSSFTVDAPEKAFLNEHDYTAVSFWIISIAMIAATVFFYAEAATVHSHWKTSLHVGGLVTLVAAVHYMYMREYWVAVGRSPIVYRYIDWSITVPLQMIEFNLILKAAKAPIGPEGFWKLLVGTVCMLAFGYAGETKAMNPWMGFFSGFVRLGVHPLRNLCWGICSGVWCHERLRSRETVFQQHERHY